MAERRERSFKITWDDGYDQLPGWADIDFDVQNTLRWLIHAAKWDEGIYRTTVRALAKAWDRNPDTVVARLDRLAEAKYIETYFPRGHEGAVILRCYADVVKTTPKQREQIRAAHEGLDEVRAEAAVRAATRAERKRRREAGESGTQA